MEWTPTSREQERHNVTVITVGSKYEVYVRSTAPSHMQTFEQPFRTLTIKGEVNMLLKKSFLRRLLLRLLSLHRYVSSIYMYILHGSADDYITLSVFPPSPCTLFGLRHSYGKMLAFLKIMNLFRNHSLFIRCGLFRPPLL